MQISIFFLKYMRHFADDSDFMCFLSLKMMKIVEALENKGFRVPLTNEEIQLRDKLFAMARQVFCFFIISTIDFFCCTLKPVINIIYNFHASFGFLLVMLCCSGEAFR
jgi:hypothetical protein